jgi:hypothetical protein
MYIGPSGVQRQSARSGVWEHAGSPEVADISLTDRVATFLVNPEKSWKTKMIREKSGINKKSGNLFGQGKLAVQQGTCSYSRGLFNVL